jgi:hypothetical protein
MEKSAISSWVRQARHRAKKQNIYNDLSTENVELIVENYGKCAYCEKECQTLDHAFPLKDAAPNVVANILPCCKKCKKDKKNNDLIWMYNNKKISKSHYVKLLKIMLERPGGEILKEHIKAITGII